MFKLVALDDLLLLENLERVHLAGVLLDHKEHLAVGAFSDYRLGDEVFDLHFSCFLLLRFNDRLIVCDLFLTRLP